MNPIYSHRQSSGFLKLLVIAPAPFLFLLVPLQHDARAAFALVPVVGVLALIGLFFTSLTIEVDEQELRWHFGPGVWNKRIARDQIVSAQVVKNPWWYGWGIHRTPRGWLYNVGGLDAVEATLNSGKTFRLGTDEPEELARALAPAVR